MFIIISSVIVVMLSINTKTVINNRKIEDNIESFVQDKFPKGCDLKCLIEKVF